MFNWNTFFYKEHRNAWADGVYRTQGRSPLDNVEHRAIEVFRLTLLIGSQYLGLFRTMVTVLVLEELVRNS